MLRNSFLAALLGVMALVDTATPPTASPRRSPHQRRRKIKHGRAKNEAFYRNAAALRHRRNRIARLARRVRRRRAA